VKTLPTTNRDSHAGEAGMAAVEATNLSFFLLANGADRNLRLFTTSLLLVGALLLGAILVALVGRWRRRQEAKEDLSPGAQLAQYRSLYEAGTISREEFERLRNLLNAQMRQSLGLSAPDPVESPRSDAPPNGQRPDNPPTGVRPA
jgi:hypothetical protein